VTSAFTSVTQLGLTPTRAGKVREVLDLGTELLMVVSDRISAFDCVLPTAIPGKGRLLNRISAHWFRGLAGHVPSHFLSDQEDRFPSALHQFLPSLRDRWMLVRKAQTIPVECVVRGYLAGSGLAEYREKGTVGGIPMPGGIPPYGRLPEPLFTPTTKEQVGHDLPVTYAELCDRVGADLAATLKADSLRIYGLAEPYARARGLTLVDTKFEFGFVDGVVTLIDEVLTPDSSRYWDLQAPAQGSPVSLDKEYIRSYLKTLTWDRNPPAPPLPDEQVREAIRRYTLVHDRLGVGGPPPLLAEPGRNP
jgi:phosphoribosylaminoimidazole-succinocarboxamide synthase